MRPLTCLVSGARPACRWWLLTDTELCGGGSPLPPCYLAGSLRAVTWPEVDCKNSFIIIIKGEILEINMLVRKEKTQLKFTSQFK